MLTRRQLFRTGLVSGCAACGALATSRLFAASATDASVPSKIEGPGYSLSYLGSQRQTILTGDCGQPAFPRARRWRSPCPCDGELRDGRAVLRVGRSLRLADPRNTG